MNGAAPIPGTDRMADPNGGGGRQTKGHHECQRRDIQRNLMRAKRDRIERACQRAHRGEHAHLQRHL